MMRLNSVFSDHKDRMNYSMMFETPQRKKYKDEDPFESAL